MPHKDKKPIIKKNFNDGIAANVLNKLEYFNLMPGTILNNKNNKNNVKV
jgi:hypothetical protein